MFNPAKYPPADIEKLTIVCEAPSKGAFGQFYRDGTAEEWKIIEGLILGAEFNVSSVVILVIRLRIAIFRMLKFEGPEPLSLPNKILQV